jgi:Pectinacetylesterase
VIGPLLAFVQRNIQQTKIKRASGLMQTLKTHILRTLCVALLLGLTACSDSSDDPLAGLSCGPAAAGALQACISDVSAAIASCYESDDEHCSDDHPDILAAQGNLQSTLQGTCADGEFLGLSSEATVGRLQNSCKSQADSIAWRTFGGPQGAIWPDASDEDKTCLQTAHETVTEFFSASLTNINECLAGDTCDAETVQSSQADAAAGAVETIASACPALADLIAVGPETYVEYASDQLDCTMATVHDDVAPFNPQCGPSNADTMPERGEWTQIILDSEEWGTMCGDGTDFAIHLKLAPEGSPLDRVIVALQGGGVCLFESDCASRLVSNPGLFNAQDDSPIGGGIAGDNPDNPFRDWTTVYVPYCNQDVFMGGGIVEDFGSVQIPRYGAINLRAGVRLARDIIWRAMDEEGGAGFRPDELIALFGGFSAGGYGAMYNYHWMLDDLQWPRTAAFPDAGGGLDNGSAAGVSFVGEQKLPAWNAQPYLPSYCFDGGCAVGPVIYEASSPRLKQVPEQQYLILSNQKDTTQQADAFFFDEAQWIDTMRSAYCDTKDLPGIQWYLTSESVDSTHVVSIRDEFFYGEVAGEKMVDWFWRAVTDPDSIEDRAEEGNFTTDIPGSSPFPCALP